MSVAPTPAVGHPELVERPRDRDRLVRLHAGENPFGASAGVYDAIASEMARVHHYPDPSSRELVEAIAELHGVSTEQISVGNGVDEMILFLILALRDEHRPAVITEATFQSYQESLIVARQRFVCCPLDGYRLPVAEIAAQLRSGSPLAFVCNPHNPTGSTLARGELAELQRAATDGDGVLIVDEAYAEYAGRRFASALPLTPAGADVCVLRTLSKAYGLAGLRVGYAVGSPSLIARVQAQHRPLPYRVNRLAQVAAVAALADQDFVRRSSRQVAQTRDWLREELGALGLHGPPSAANFVLVRAGSRAAELCRDLDRRGFRVRDTSTLGLPGHIRISIGARGDMITLLDTIAEMLTHDPPGT